MEIFSIITGLAAGFMLGILVFRVFQQNREKKQVKLVVQNEERLKIIETENSKLAGQIAELTKQREQLQRQVTLAEAENNSLFDKLQTQKRDIDELHKKFTLEFENIAAKILEKNSEKFTATNQKNMGDVLNPLKEKIELFERKVEDTYKQGLKDQTDLRAELKKLFDLNSKISEEANNLTKALKGDVKKQGNWGEVVLERILERSGLNEGAQGYEKQFSDTSEDGRRIQPDIVINLPDNKHIIVDSKVSLIAYERAVNAETEEERAKYVKDHILSLKAHCKGLSEKHYQSARHLNSPDFVLLFIPIESSFSIAIQEDQDIFSYAWDMKVVLVSPSTLLATLRTIASIWQQENQTHNAMEIARQGGALYDKFVGFISDMERIGKSISSTQSTYNDAMNKLHTGSGNLVSRVESIKKLGAKTTKELPKLMLDE
ncbi:MAG TPA: DNA recombination protein RmuC [Draconibacterium sp.]|nr:DNA recombination protein RmuC [Draconibacterium sp.]